MANLKRASQQLFSRPNDERFESFEALQSHCNRMKESSTLHWQLPTEFTPCPMGLELGLQIGGDGIHWQRDGSALMAPKRLCVIRATERILLPDKGAQFGQFGALNASAKETWVMDAESMLGDAKKPFDIARTIQRGANNRVYLCRIIWGKPNRLGKP